VLASLLAFWLAVRPPRLLIPGTPADYGLRAEEVRIRAADGARLAGWLLPRPGAPAVILLHGYPANKADLLPVAGALAPEFTVLLLDLRGLGDSQGRVTTLGLRERDDLRRAVEFLQGRSTGPIGVFGLSLGGAVAILAAAQEPRIRAVAAYAPFADLAALGHDLYGWLGPLKYVLVELMRAWGRLFLGGDLTRPAPAEAARALGIPVLLIHSPGDEQIPFAHAERLRDAMAGNPRAELWALPRGRHGELPGDFYARLGRFFRAHLAAEPASRGPAR
jgi:pimeloyl-ACP methyl ester carboxylesterase